MMRSAMRGFLSDQRGSLMVMAAFAVLLLFVGIFALTIDTGLSFKDQSNLEAKLANCANYAAAEYTYFSIRKGAGAGIRAKTDGLLLPNPRIKPEEALERLRLYVQDCVRGGELNELKEALVTRIAIEYNSAGQAILVFDASTPQSQTFSGNKPDATLTTQSGKLLPFFLRDATAPTLPVGQNAGISLMLDCRSDQQPGPRMRALASLLRRLLLSLNMPRPDLMYYGLDTRVQAHTDGEVAALSPDQSASGHFVFVTDSSCLDHEAARSSAASGTSGDALGLSYCAIGTRPQGWQAPITTADCAAEILWALSGERPEVRKAGLSAEK